jgi:hypothetical protein
MFKSASEFDTDSDNWGLSEWTVLDSVVNQPNTRIGTISYDIEQEHYAIKLWNSASAKLMCERQDAIAAGVVFQDLVRPAFDESGKYFVAYIQSCIEVIDARSAATIRIVSIREWEVDLAMKAFNPRAISISGDGKRLAAAVIGPISHLGTVMFPQNEGRRQPVDVMRTVDAVNNVESINNVKLAYVARGRRLFVVGCRHRAYFHLKGVVVSCWDVKARTRLQEYQVTTPDGNLDGPLSYMTFGVEFCLAIRNYYVTRNETSICVFFPDGTWKVTYTGPHAVHGIIPGGVTLLDENRRLRVWDATKDVKADGVRDLKEVATMEYEDLPIREITGLAVSEKYVTLVTDDERFILLRKG